MMHLENHVNQYLLICRECILHFTQTICGLLSSKHGSDNEHINQLGTEVPTFIVDLHLLARATFQTYDMVVCIMTD